MSDLTCLDDEQPIRGGIPICWPWFGAGRAGNTYPLHGFARLSEWRLVKSSADTDTAKATYLLISDGGPSFPHPFRLTYEVSFGAEFTASLTVRNTGTSRFSFEESLHTYLRVSDARRIVIKGLGGVEYLDKAKGAKPGPQTQVGNLIITSEVDRIYHSKADIVIEDPQMKRALTVARKGSSDVVVWNPWVDKARDLTDFGDDEWQTMVCVEAGNVGEHAVTLAAGKEHTIGFTLSVSAL
jgi:glucose-6-phosphate 1-epimerase